jgi:multisubunit Na+/H+ antiporter MnhG subunit
VRIYLKMRLVTAQACGFFASAVGFGSLGVGQLPDLHSRWIRLTADIVAVVSLVVALVLLVKYENGLKARPQV